MYNIHDHFFIPLTDITIDTDRLRNEVFRYIRPVQHDYGLTCIKEDSESNNFNFRKFSGIRKPSSNKYLLPSGHLDTDVIYWPKILQGSYIEQVALEITNLLELSPPRCRLSYFNNRDYPFNIGYHYDNHTPYRVHIALKTTPECIWKYRWGPEQEEHELHQPILNNPVLINTGAMQHAVYVPKNHSRLHLWYQYHGTPRQELINNLIEKYKSSKI
jgi:hypothetical protein